MTATSTQRQSVELPGMTLSSELRDGIFRPLFPIEQWRNWLVAIKATEGLALSDDELALYRQCTGRTAPPTRRASEAWWIVGRRGGKSRMAALCGIYLGFFHDYRPYLAPGELATVQILASGRRQCRTIMRYMLGVINAVPMLRTMLASEPTKEVIELQNRVIVEVQTASVAAVRNYTLAGAICDELAFWANDEDGANPAVDVLNAIRPGMATIPHALLICLSTPYARRGALWEAYHEHFGRDDDDVLVWCADTATMHPHAPDSRLGHLIAKAYADDEASAAAEYGALFRRDVETFVAREVIDACVIPNRAELPAFLDARYVGFVDPSGGSQDSMTLAVAHSERSRDGWQRVILDAVREVKPPFSPDAVVRDFAEVLQKYRVTTITGDRYGGEWPRERFRRHGISYRCSEQPKSDLYRDLLPHLNACTVELLDHPRLIHQLCSLERRTARSGKDSIDHPPRGHDDIANAVAGAVLLAADAKCRTMKPIRVVGW